MQRSHSPSQPTSGTYKRHWKCRSLVQCAATAVHQELGQRSAGSRSASACRPSCSFLGCTPDCYQPAQLSGCLHSRCFSPMLKTRGSSRATRRIHGCHERRSFYTPDFVRYSSAISCAAISGTAATQIRRQQRIADRPFPARVSLLHGRTTCFSLCANLSRARRTAPRMNTGKAIERNRLLCCLPSPEQATPQISDQLDRQVSDYS